jgi:hypothetical protein
MTKMMITPFKNCGPVSQNDDFWEIKKNFSGHQEFRKSPFSKFLTSSIMDGNLHVFYSETGKCVGVEVFSPLEPVWDGINLLTKKLKEVEILFNERNIVCEVTDTGLEVPDLGISLYSHNFETSLNCPIDSVYVNFIDVPSMSST